MNTREVWTAFTAGQVKGRGDAGQSTRVISEEMGRPQSSVAYVSKKMKHTGTWEHEPRPGKPPKLSKMQERNAMQCVKDSQRFSKPEKMAKDQNLDISASTMRRILLKYSMKSYSTKKTVALTEAVKKDRKECAEVAKMVDWGTVLFSDECYIDIHIIGGRKKRVWRTPEEAGNACFMIQQNAASRKTVMVFAAVGLGYKSELVILDMKEPIEGEDPKKYGTVTGKRYAHMIRRFLGPWYIAFSNKLPFGDVALSVEDNAPVHGTKETWEQRTYFDMIRLCHPARSPDLNAIETVWGMLKERLKSLDIYCSTYEELAQKLKECWADIDQVLIDRQILKMAGRYDMVYENDGGAIPDFHDTKPDPDSIPHRSPLADISNNY